MKRKSKAVASKVAASLVINHPDTMTTKGRRQIAKWIKDRADNLILHGHKLAPRFTARYYYAP